MCRENIKVRVFHDESTDEISFHLLGHHLDRTFLFQHPDIEHDRGEFFLKKTTNLEGIFRLLSVTECNHEEDFYCASIGFESKFLLKTGCEVVFDPFVPSLVLDVLVEDLLNHPRDIHIHQSSSIPIDDILSGRFRVGDDGGVGSFVVSDGDVGNLEIQTSFKCLGSSRTGILDEEPVMSLLEKTGVFGA